MLVRCVLLFAALFTAPVFASSDDEPIRYSTAPLTDPIARLQKKIDSGEVVLDVDPRFGMLKSVLKALNVPASSQMLVFSKTSFQRAHISPDTPRALYFGDDVYVGKVLGSEVLEFSVVDPNLGAVFYTLTEKKDEKPTFRRQTDNCLQCHESSMTENNPGHIARSVFPDAEGQPILSAGTFRINFESPIKERWGGWYVTGKSGAQKHMGNVISADREHPEKTDFTAGTNVTDLTKYIETSSYLTPHSDIAALMVMEYQTRVQNLITRANYLTRFTLRDEQVINKALNRAEKFRSDSTISRFKNACDPLIKALLCCDEAALTERIEGTSGFAKEFSELGPRDKKGRSLRELDLTRRLFKYPCGYLIYSEAFNALPKEATDYIYKRLWEILNRKDAKDAFPKLADADRAAILEILLDTKPNLPDYWHNKDAR
jgi:hypothetical protein